MKRSIAVFAFLAIISQVAPGATKVDSVLAVTGEAVTRCVWARWPWADNSYTPVQAYKSTYYENDHNFTQVAGFSTEDGKTRYIDSTIGNHCFPRLTRKDGKYVIWNDNQNKCAWIRDYACTVPRKKLIPSGDYFVLATQYNPGRDSEFIYVMGNYDGRWVGQSIARIPLKGDSAILSGKTTVVDGGGNDIDWHANASQDGKYIGCMVPQPDAYMWQAGTTNKIGRHADGLADGGCQPNIAPDNSYRFFHLLDAHLDIGMFGPGTTAGLTAWSVNIVTMLPGNTQGGDASQPRWTNDVRFMTVSYPHALGFYNNNSGNFNAFFNLTSSNMNTAANAAKAGSFCLAKFSADFKTVESAVRVSDGDVRHRDVVGDAFVVPSTTVIPGAPQARAPDMRSSLRGRCVVVATSAHARAGARLTDAQGRIVKPASGARGDGAAGDVGAGVYITAPAR